MLASAATDAERIDVLFRRALARPAKAAEKESLTAFLAARRASYRDDPAAARKVVRVGLAPLPPGADEPELAAWTQVCRVVLNLHETITRN